jgi:uncharacterized protein
MAGFVIISIGIVGIIMSRLGAAPIDAFNYFVYTLTPYSLGTIAILTGLLAAAVAFAIEKKKDIWISVAFLFLIGLLIDLWKYLFEMIPQDILTSYYFRVPLAAFSLIIVSYGVSLTIVSGLPSSPFERLLLALTKYTKNLMLTKIAIEGTFLILAIILGILSGQLFEQVHIYTVVLTFSIGPLVSVFMKLSAQHKTKRGEMIYATQ